MHEISQLVPHDGAMSWLDRVVEEGDEHLVAEATIRAWMAEKRGGGLDAVVINTSGCGTTVKDYGYMFRGGPLA